MKHSDPKGLARCQHCGSDTVMWDPFSECPGDPKVTHPTYLAALRDRKLFLKETAATLEGIWGVPFPPATFVVDLPPCPKCGGSHVGECGVHRSGPGQLTLADGTVLFAPLGAFTLFLGDGSVMDVPPEKK